MKEMDNQETLNTLKQFKQERGHAFGLNSLGIFGSYARGEAREDSDVDIVVEMEQPNLLKTVHLKEELEARLQKKVDIVRYRQRMNNYLKKHIEEESIYVWREVGSGNIWANSRSNQQNPTSFSKHSFIWRFSQFRWRAGYAWQHLHDANSNWRESLKKVDRITKGKLLSQYPEMDWKGFKGVRDVISHHYFDIDAEEIFTICDNDIIPLSNTIQKIIKSIDI